MVIRTWLALAVLCAGTARGAGPSYSAAGIVNASNFTAGPFAPNSVVSIFGTNLAFSSQALADADLVACGTAQLPARCISHNDLNGVRVYVQDQPVPVLFVSPGQVNFIMSSTETAGPVTIRVVNNGNTGPYATVTLVDAAPALFPNPVAAGYAIAQDAKGNLLTADAPAHAGDIVVLYATGLGRTSPSPAVFEIPAYAASICQMSQTIPPICSSVLALASLKVTLNGMALDPKLILYAGVTPGSAGLYQINLSLPEGTGNDPEIHLTAGNLTAQTGLKLPLR